MKKIISGQLFKLLVLVSSISILAACDASDALDLAGEIDNGGGGTTTFGSVSVSGVDASVIGNGFEPTIRQINEPGAGILIAIFGDAEASFPVLSGIGRILVVSFDGNSVPISIGYNVVRTNTDAEYTYVTDCSVNDCSGISLNSATNVITLASVTVFVEADVSANVATGSVVLNGSVTHAP